MATLTPMGQRGGLRLSLNRSFPELDNPKAVAKVVGGLVRWAKGHVGLGVATLSQIPYALGLIRQSLERQLDEEA